MRRPVRPVFIESRPNPTLKLTDIEAGSRPPHRTPAP